MKDKKAIDAALFIMFLIYTGLAVFSEIKKSTTVIIDLNFNNTNFFYCYFLI